jgi:hypothetical protein
MMKLQAEKQEKNKYVTPQRRHTKSLPAPMLGPETAHAGPVTTINL